MVLFIVLALRLVVPLSIFRWPLGGGGVTMLLDGTDVILADVIACLLGEPLTLQLDYHTFDKWLDIYYLSLF